MKKIKMTTVLAAGVVALCGFGFTGCSDSIRYEKYANADEYKVGEASFAATAIRKVEIDWIGGSIEIEKSSGDTLHVVEDERSEKEEERMRYYLDGNVLKIKYCQSGLRTNIKAEHKNLRLDIPKGVELDLDCVSAVVTVGVIEVSDFSVESVSGNITASRIDCAKADLETVSGTIVIGELNATTSISMETVSGDVTVSGLSATFLEVESTSADVNLGLHLTNQSAVEGFRAEVESTSANVNFMLNADMGASIRFETGSGKFHSERAHTALGATRYDIFGSLGKCLIEVETVSGNLRIQ